MSKHLLTFLIFLWATIAYSQATAIRIMSEGEISMKSPVFDVGGHLTSGHSPHINHDFYSTAFGACDAT